MAHLSVVQAVEARLQANFTHCPIRLENSFSETPDDAGAFLLLDFPFSRSRQVTIGSPGSNRYEEEGAFRVLLSIPSGVGTHEGRGWLDEISTLFRGKLFDGVRTYSPQSAPTDDRNDAAAYFRLAISVPYDFSLFG